MTIALLCKMFGGYVVAGGMHLLQSNADTINGVQQWLCKRLKRK
ncbi:hypothetical protein [Fimbriiglobus ruber]|nr:hypothetical protein [Fimbriiglobus ruber]